MDNPLKEKEAKIHDIIIKYSNMVYQLAFARTRKKQDADDIFQEVFLRYVRKMPLFENEEHEKAWFLRVTINCSNHFLKNSFRQLPTECIEEYVPAYNPQKEEFPPLDLYLERLPAKYRMVIHLFYYEEMGTKQISQLLHKKDSTVRMQLTRARNLLKTYLEQDHFHI